MNNNVTVSHFWPCYFVVILGVILRILGNCLLLNHSFGHIFYNIERKSDESFTKEQKSFEVTMTTDHSSCSVTPNNSRSCSPSCLAVADDTNTYVKAEPTPVFLIYTDSELKLAANNDSLSDELRNRLVRNTWSNMRTACQNLRNPREPTAKEFEDMAKALVVLDRHFGLFSTRRPRGAPFPRAMRVFDVIFSRSPPP